MSYVPKNHPQQVAEKGVNESVDDRATPWEVFDPLNREFRFTVDAAASPLNNRLPRFWTRESNALAQEWAGERVWCNPPYSDIEPWVQKAWVEAAAECVVMLLPANRSEQGWWQRHVEPFRDGKWTHIEVPNLTTRFLPGRIRFVAPDLNQHAEAHDLFGGRSSTRVPDTRPPFGCVLLIWSR